MIRLLTFTNLYPSEQHPRHGIFVEERLQRLVRSGRVRAAVVVPVARQWTRGMDSTARNEQRGGIPVHYCSFPAWRGVTSWLNPMLMARFARDAVTALQQEQGDFDLVDAHFLYPDGVAAMRIGGWLNLPVVLTARGSDVNVALGERIAGGRIRRATNRAAALIAVSNALRDAMVAGGIRGDRIQVIRNGVDLGRFRPMNRAALRSELGINGPALLAVGNLVPEKGHLLLLDALAQLPDVQLIVIGSGPLESSLRAVAANRGISQRIVWRAPMSQESLARHYAAADVTVLTSTREGMPNVLLESLACGTPVVATAVGGCAEIITEPVAGRLVRDRTAAALAAAIRELLEAPPSAASVREFAARFSWDEPVTRQIALYESVLRRPARH